MHINAVMPESVGEPQKAPTVVVPGKLTMGNPWCNVRNLRAHIFQWVYCFEEYEAPNKDNWPLIGREVY